MAQSERRIRIIEAGGESLGLKQHAFGHVAPPALHRGAKYPKGQAALGQMRGYREAIRTRSDDDSIYIHNSLFRPCIGSVCYTIYGFPREQAVPRFVHGRCTILDDIS